MNYFSHISPFLWSTSIKKNILLPKSNLESKSNVKWWLRNKRLQQPSFFTILKEKERLRRTHVVEYRHGNKENILFKMGRSKLKPEASICGNEVQKGKCQDNNKLQYAKTKGKCSGITPDETIHFCLECICEFLL